MALSIYIYTLYTSYLQTKHTISHNLYQHWFISYSSLVKCPTHLQQTKTFKNKLIIKLFVQIILASWIQRDSYLFSRHQKQKTSNHSSHLGRFSPTGALGVGLCARFLPWRNGRKDPSNPNASNGCFLKWWYLTTMGFPTENDHFEVFWGYHHFRNPPNPPPW